MAGGVDFKWNGRFWAEAMADPALSARLQSEAERLARAADARCGTGRNQASFKNRENYVAKVAKRSGTTASYPVGLVIAANPRSIYKSKHDGTLRA